MPCRNHPDNVEALRTCPGCGGSFCRICIDGAQRSCPECRESRRAGPRGGIVPGDLELAGIGQRFLAQLIDGLILLSAIVVLGAITYAGFFVVFDQVNGVSYGNTSGGNAAGGMAAFGFAIGMFLIIALVSTAGSVCYESIMLSLYGQTLGKKVVGIVVVRQDGSPISTSQAWGRAATRCALFMVPGYLGVIIDILFIFSEARKTVHDHAAATIVVIKPAGEAEPPH